MPLTAPSAPVCPVPLSNVAAASAPSTSSLTVFPSWACNGIGAATSRSGEYHRSVAPRINERKRRKRLAVYQRDLYRCKLCGKQLTYEDATLDHVIPRSRGGSGALNNLVTACKPCNQWKDDKMMREHGYEWNHWTMEWEKFDGAS